MLYSKQNPHARFVELLRNAVIPQSMREDIFFTAKVKEITGDCCTVLLVYEDSWRVEPPEGGNKPFPVKLDPEWLELTDVRLKTSVNEELSTLDDYFLTIPKVGTNVICGTLNGDLSDLFVIQCEAVEKIVYVRGTLKMSIDGEDGKISAESEGVSVLGLFDSLANILKELKVYTNIGPSGNPLPDTIAQIQAFEKEVRTVFK